jgi:hypothetical protein
MRLESKTKITRLAKYALLIYIVISLFYTTSHYFASHHDIQTTRKYDIQDKLDHILPKEPVILEKNNREPMSYPDQVTWPGSKGKI